MQDAQERKVKSWEYSLDYYAYNPTQGKNTSNTSVKGESGDGGIGSQTKSARAKRAMFIKSYLSSVDQH